MENLTGSDPAGSDPTWVKICGTTNPEDAKAAVQAGADAVGFVFVPASPRAVSRKRVSEILRELPDTVLTVGVVADEDPDFLKGLLRVCPLKGLQFHGEEPPEKVLAFKGRARLIKAIRVRDAESLKQIPLYRGVDAILLDRHDPRRKGGTGEAFDWGLAVQAKSYGIPIIVAGGLTPDNVVQVVKRVRPYGVDVATGVELSTGRKDPALVREFLVRAKSL
ncbi:MAG: phosphoribosylanthranilate isomerase [Candidatus Omnitrophica bacterium]|nr:phosphoribosylanthranilate isomerase [Candidatus Omnitrophota bacterium]